MKIINYPLSNKDIENVLGSDTKIITYPELANYKTIEELLPKEFDFVVILILEKPNSGHWTSLIRYQNTYEFFDSYGNPPDYDLMHWLTVKQRTELKENTTYLSNLLKGHRVIFNRVRYQQMKDGVNDCGDHICYRIYKFKHDNFSLRDYHQHIQNLCKMYGTTPDDIVCEFIMHCLS